MVQILATQKVATPLSHSWKNDPPAGMFRSSHNLWLDPWLGGLLFLLSGSSLLVLASAAPHLVEGQLLRFGIAWSLLIIVAHLPPHHLHRWAYLFYGGTVALLVAVLLFGITVKGAQRWLDLGIFRFQPSELAKLSVPLAVARWLADGPLPPNAMRLGVAALLLLFPLLLIAKQPDLGTALLVALAGGTVIFFAGLPWRILLLLTVFGVAGAYLGWEYLLYDYQRDRILVFLDPYRDPLGKGYHAIQAMIAVGSGGLFGQGWRHGSQTQLDYLPEPHTDFIFAVVAEEFGFLGAVALASLYLLIFLRGLLLALPLRRPFNRILVASFALTFFLSASINMAMVIGLLPIVGVPLPWMSYGGTSLLTLACGFGMMMALAGSDRRLL